eukprot:218928-Chlamydomonas_euryale.AAC.1
MLGREKRWERVAEREEHEGGKEDDVCVGSWDWSTHHLVDRSWADDAFGWIREWTDGWMA